MRDFYILISSYQERNKIHKGLIFSKRRGDDLLRNKYVPSGFALHRGIMLSIKKIY